MGGIVVVVFVVFLRRVRKRARAMSHFTCDGNGVRDFGVAFLDLDIVQTKRSDDVLIVSTICDALLRLELHTR